MRNLTVIIGLVIFSSLVGCDTTNSNGQTADSVKATISTKEKDMELQSKATLDIAMKFMEVMGKGDMETMISLMHDDMVWQNAGDSDIPWIGPWKGKKAILEDFMPKFGAGFKTIKWEPSDAFASGDTAAFFGQMIGELTNTGVQTEEFTYALRVKVKDGKVILWNWFEDSYEVSKAFKNK